MATPIQYQSALPALLTQLMGTKQTSSGGTSSNTSSSQTISSADTDPLRQIFGYQSGSSTPEGMAALIQEVFTKGAEAVPTLTNAYANAAGARSSKNSGLQLALGELNRGLAGQAATLVGDQQAKAAQTAAAIAQATRGQTTTNTGTNTAPKTVIQTGNPKGAGLATGLGFALNAADKLGLTKALKGGIGKMFEGNVGGGDSALDINSLSQDYDSYDLQGGANPNLFGAPVSFDSMGDFGSFAGNVDNFGSYSGFEGLNSFDIADMTGDVFSGGMDFSGWSDDAFGDITSGFDWGGGWDGGMLGNGGFSDVYDYSGEEWFSDGGLVKKPENMFSRRRAALEAAESAAVSGNDANAAFQRRLKEVTTSPPTKKTGYADGGIIRNKNNMGGPLAGGARSGAVNVREFERQQDYSGGNAYNSGSSGGSITSAQLMADPVLRDRFLAELDKRNQKQLNDHMAAIAKDTAARLPGENPGSDVTGGDPGPGGAAGALGSMGMGIASTLGGMLGGPLGSLAVNALGKALNAPSPMTPTSLAINGIKAAIAAQMGGGATAGGTSASDSMADTANAAAAATNSDPLDSLMATTGAFGTNIGGFGGFGGASAVGEGPGMGPGASAGDANAGEGGTGSGFGGGSSGGVGDGFGGDTATAADGGHIKGKGTGISDSIPARLSDGEFVLSKDVVDMLGVDFLQSIQDRFHTPAAIQKVAGAR